MNKKEFIVFCEESYGVEGNTHQHIIDALANSNKVYFIGASLPFKFSNFFKKRTLNKLEKNVFNFKYINFFPNPFPNGFIGRLVLQLNDKINYNRFLKLTDDKKKDIIYFDPTKGVYFQGNVKYYYVLDPYYNRPFDKLFAKKANQIMVVNSDMKTKYIDLNNEIKTIPHGVPIPNVSSDKTAQLTKNFEDYVLLMGSLSDLIDFPLFDKLTLGNLNTNFVVIGKTSKMNTENTQLFEKITSRNNVFYEGLINYKEIDNYISASKVGLILYFQEMFKYKNPIKITNYLANHKIILNTFELEDLKGLEGKVLFTSTTHEKYIELFEKAINGYLKVDDEFVNGYSNKYTYSNLVNDLFLKKM